MLARKPLLSALALLCAAAVLGFLPRIARSAPAAPQSLGSVSGRVLLQGCATHEGITVQVGSVSTTTDASGAFSLPSVEAGTPRAEAAKAGFLSAVREGVVVAPGEAAALAEVTLPAGDVDGDDDIDLFDLVLMGAAFGQCPPGSAGLDPNADGCVNILDLVLLGGNYNQRGPVAWEMAPSPTPATPTATVPATPTVTALPSATITPTLPAANGVEARLVPEFPAAQVGEMFTLDIRLTSPDQPIDGATIHLDFDPAYLAVVDAAGSPANQIAPEPALAIVFDNRADNARGQIDYVAGATLPPAIAPTGSFVVARVRFRALAATAGTEVRFVFEPPRWTRTLYEGLPTLQSHVNALVTISN